MAGRPRALIVPLLTSLTAAVLLTALPASAFGSSVLVDKADATPDTGGCGTSTNPCNTIQGGVDSAVAGDEVRVAAGNYIESVQVGKSLTLSGAQSGNDARTRAGVPEASVMGPPNRGVFPCFDLRAPDVRIDGFTLQAAQAQSGVLIHATAPRALITNSIVAGTVGLDNTDGSAFTKNRFQSGGIFGTAPNANVVVDRNLFEGSGRAMEFDSVSGILISGNTLVHRPIVLRSDTEVTIEDNKIDGPVSDYPAGISLYGGLDLLVQGNSISGNPIGINVDTAGVDGSPAELVSIIGNTIVDNIRGIQLFSGYKSATSDVEVHYNRIVRNRDLAIAVYDQSSTVDPRVVGAEDNWWGCNDGVNRGSAKRCPSARGVVYTEPHLVLSLTSPAAIPRSGEGVIRVGISSSDGTSIPTGFFPPVDVGFGATSGTIASAVVPLERESAQTAFTGPGADTVVTVSASLDNATLTSPVTVGAGNVGGTGSGSSGPGPKPSASPSKCVVPRLRGLSVARAKKKLGQAGCRFKIVGRGYVRSTSPAAGTGTSRTVTVRAKRKKIHIRGHGRSSGSRGV